MNNVTILLVPLRSHNLGDDDENDGAIYVLITLSVLV